VNAPSQRNTNWGPSHHKAKLSTAQVDEMRDAYERGEGGYRRLGQRFGVSWQTVRGICKCERRYRG
jgi:hypothetical protein